MKLYGGGSPNAQKIVLMLEELGLAFALIKVDVYGGEQYSPAFLALNPIGKYPVLIDGEGAAAGQPIFESCALLIYLAETYGPDRKSVVEGKSVSVRVALGGRLINKKKN